MHLDCKACWGGACRVRVLHDRDLGRARRLGAPHGVGVVPLELGRGQVLADLRLGDLGVVDQQLGAVCRQALAHIDCRRLTRVASVLQAHAGCWYCIPTLEAGLSLG